MHIYITIITIAWIAFIAYWIFSAISSKKTIRGGNWRRGVYFRLGAVVILILLFKTNVLSVHWLISSHTFSNPIIPMLGAGLTLIGIALAIWARVYLGTNWGMPMSLKENPELVTTGPYAYIRNPIYTGMLIALLGSALVAGNIWLVYFVCAGVYFIYSSKQEEKIMAKEFPSTYPEYKTKTKMLIPWVF